MYRVGICDDDKVLCSLLEEQIQGLSADISVKFEIEVWYSGESLERDLKKGVGLDLLFLDIELLQKMALKQGLLSVTRWKIQIPTSSIFPQSRVMRWSFSKCSH